jgi:2-phospho-L-lactate/phosphoenolpyruvate guanylyltransferase
MSNPTAILPMKNFADAKQRLSATLDPAPRRALVEAMFSDVLVALGRTTMIEGLVVVSSDHGAQRIAAGYGATVLEDEQDGHNEAAALGVRHALELGAERVLLVPGDCPVLDPSELDELIAQRVPRRSVVIVPDRHGSGTNALLLTPPAVIQSAFGPGSRERHESLTREAGAEPLTVEVPSLALDIDTPEDLLAAETLLANQRGGAAHTRGMLRQLARSMEFRER